MNALRGITLVLLTFPVENADPAPAFALVKIDADTLVRLRQHQALVTSHRLMSINAGSLNVEWIVPGQSEDDELQFRPVNDQSTVTATSVHWMAQEKGDGDPILTEPVDLDWLDARFWAATTNVLHAEGIQSDMDHDAEISAQVGAALAEAFAEA